MTAPARSVNESERLCQLYELDILDTPPEPQLDQIAELAGAMFQTPIALVSLVDDERQWFKARIGLPATETPRDISFCAHAILSDDVLVIRDALTDARFAASPLVLGPPFIRFYAGAPLKAPAGQKLGTLCVIDQKPREDFADADAAKLRRLADLIETNLTFRFLAQRLMLEMQDRQDLFAGFERERVSYEKRLREKRSILTRAIIELEGPVSALKTVAAALEETDRATRWDASAQPEARIVIDAADALSNALSGLRHATKTLVRPYALDRTPLSLKELIQECVETLGPSATVSGAALKMHLPDHPVTILGDRLKLKQVFFSLLSNSLKYTATGAVIRVTLAAPEFGMARVTIADTGVGITQTELERAFVAFDQAAAIRPGAARATGQGLATAMLIVERHGGLMSLDSKIGKGTTVTVRLACT